LQIAAQASVADQGNIKLRVCGGDFGKGRGRGSKREKGGRKKRMRRKRRRNKKGVPLSKIAAQI